MAGNPHNPKRVYGHYDKPRHAEFKPTPANRKTVAYLAISGITQDEISDCLDIDRKTLAKHFDRELKTGKTEVTGRCVGQLVAKIDEGNLQAIIFYLKTRCGWKETQVTEHAGELNVNTSATELLTSRIASIAARNRQDSGDKVPE